MRDIVRYVPTGCMRDHRGLPGFQGHDARDAGQLSSATYGSPAFQLEGIEVYDHITCGNASSSRT